LTCFIINDLTVDRLKKTLNVDANQGASFDYKNNNSLLYIMHK